MPKRKRVVTKITERLITWCVKNEAVALVISEANVRVQIGTRRCKEMELFLPRHRRVVMEEFKSIASLPVTDGGRILENAVTFWDPHGKRIIAAARVTALPPIGSAPEFLLVSFVC